MATNGNKFRVFIKVGSTGTAAILGGETTSSLSVSGNLIDISDKDSNWLTQMFGQKSWSCSAEANYKPSDTAQKAAIDNLLADDSAEADVTICQVGADNAIGTDVGWKGKALISGFDISEPQNDVVTVSFTISGTGKLEPVKTS